MDNQNDKVGEKEMETVWCMVLERFLQVKLKE